MNKNVYITEKIFRSFSLIFAGSVFCLAMAYVSAELPQNVSASPMQVSIAKDVDNVVENISDFERTDDLAMNQALK